MNKSYGYRCVESSLTGCQEGGALKTREGAPGLCLTAEASRTLAWEALGDPAFPFPQAPSCLLFRKKAHHCQHARSLSLSLSFCFVFNALGCISSDLGCLFLYTYALCTLLPTRLTLTSGKEFTLNPALFNVPHLTSCG